MIISVEILNTSKFEISIKDTWNVNTNVILYMIVLKNVDRDFAGGPVAKIPCSQYRGPQIQSLFKELDPRCCN